MPGDDVRRACEAKGRIATEDCHGQPRRGLSSLTCREHDKSSGKEYLKSGNCILGLIFASLSPLLRFETLCLYKKLIYRSHPPFPQLLVFRPIYPILVLLPLQLDLGLFLPPIHLLGLFEQGFIVLCIAATIVFFDQAEAQVDPRLDQRQGVVGPDLHT